MIPFPLCIFSRGRRRYAGVSKRMEVCGRARVCSKISETRVSGRPRFRTFVAGHRSRMFRLDLKVFSPVVDRYLILPTRRGFSRLVLLRLPVRPPTPHHSITRSLLQSLCGEHVSDQRLDFGLMHVRLRGSRSHSVVRSSSQSTISIAVGAITLR